MGAKTRTEGYFKGVETALAITHIGGMWRDGLIRERAGLRHGLIHRSDLHSLMVTDREISRKIETRRIEVLHPGVYYVDSTPATWKTMVLAGVFAAGPGAVASHRCAGVLHGLDAVYGRMIEVTVPYNEEPEPDSVIVHRTRRLNPTAFVDAIPVTPVEKNLLDLAPILGERNLFKAARSAVHKGLVTPERLDSAIGRFGGRGVSGTRTFRRVVQRVAEDQSGSVAEIDLGSIIEDAPVPAPIQQLQIRLPEGGYAYPDFCWPDRVRLVEADGFTAHGSPEQLQHDLSRQNGLMELGWEIRRFTATEIRDEPLRVREEIIRFVNKPFRAGLSTEPVD